jgi:integrase
MQAHFCADMFQCFHLKVGVPHPGFQRTEGMLRRLPTHPHALRLFLQTGFKVLENGLIRAWLQIQGRMRDLALFNLAIDSKLRGCDLVALRVRDICIGTQVNERAIIIQKKTHRPVQFELTEPTRQAVQRWILESDLRDENYVFPSRVRGSTHLSTRQYARTVNPGLPALVLTRTSTERTRCVGPKRH